MATWSWSERPKWRKSGVSSMLYLEEAAGLATDWAREWNLMVWGTLVFSTKPCLTYYPNALVSSSRVNENGLQFLIFAVI